MLFSSSTIALHLHLSCAVKASASPWTSLREHNSFSSVSESQSALTTSNQKQTGATALPEKPHGTLFECRTVFHIGPKVCDALTCCGILLVPVSVWCSNLNRKHAQPQQKCRTRPFCCQSLQCSVWSLERRCVVRETDLEKFSGPNLWTLGSLVTQIGEFCIIGKNETRLLW